ncbi:restriction endonuclease subunit S [Xanthomonas oryzae pv. oryzae]|uniref:restriction endonuclease subunit S n=1 Tax=Xanthomonas oryzae TaxID=347 RepID=UPI001C679A9F|nr:restriction endonuclease subunit S [Xanthomonas oryzae]
MSDTPNIDIRPDHWQIVRDILRKHVPQYAVWAFGSRAKWLAKQYSDLDLAIITDQPLSLSISAALADEFSESDLPWKVDIVDWATTGESFRKIIERDKVVVQPPGCELAVTSQWRCTTVGDAFEVNPLRSVQRGKVTPFIPMDLLPVNERSPERIEKREFTGSGIKFKNGDTLIARITPCLENGKTAFISGLQDGEVAHGSTEYIVLGGRPNHSDGLFAYYIARSPDFRRYAIGQMEGTSGRQRVPSAAVEKYPLALPPISEQRVISRILGGLDDKIELNRRMNQTLEAMARALFKSWFVDFDGVPPDDMQKSELGLIPKGWRISTVGQEVAIVGGSTPSTTEVEHWAGGTHNWVTPKDLSSLCFPVLLATERKITDFGLSKIASGILPVGTLLLSSRAPIGYLAITEVPTAINQGFIAMKCEGVLSNVFMLNWCREKMDFIVANANGSTFLEISKSNFRPLPVIVPSAQALHAFDQYARPLHQRIVESERQSQALIQIRDTLLPKLLSGELRVKDAERIAGSA